MRFRSTPPNAKLSGENSCRIERDVPNQPRPMNSASITSRSSGRYAIIGGGAAGLGLAKTLKARGIAFEIFEAEDDFGGNWYFGKPCARVYESTHLISSKRNTEFSDFPMPADYPAYPNHRQVLEYLRSFARHFGLYERARFGTRVDALMPTDDGWRVTLSTGETLEYSGVVVANGRLHQPLQPKYSGTFAGETLHAGDYRSADVFRGRRVLIVGGGNSGCDIAVDAAGTAAKTWHSMRRGYHFMPKFIHGQPTPEWLMETASRFADSAAFWRHVRDTFKAAGFDGTDYGLPAPDHAIDQAHPIMNSRLLYHIGHGDVTSKPDVARFEGRTVHFVDGSSEDVDLVLFATGYRIAVPFLAREHLDWKGAWLDLFLHVFHRRYENLFFVGYHNAPSGLGNITNAVSHCVAACVEARERGTPAYRVFQHLKRTARPGLGHERFIQTDRHSAEVDLWKYIRALNFVRGKLEVAA